MTRKPRVAVIGAGPYGLSVAAHLESAGCTVRAFGRPLATWSESMPAGMLLKSDGFASNLSAPDGNGRLRQYCAEQGTAYSDTHLPVALETFVAYGRDFQRRYVPDLDPRDVASVERAGSGFALRVDGRDRVVVDRVVLAVGITHFRRMPACLDGLPSTHVTHSSAHRRLDRFAGHAVAVVGAGASAVETAALLADCGARPVLVTRRAALRFSSAPQDGRPPLLRRLRRPSSPLGPGWAPRLSSGLPGSFRRLPARVRLHLLRRTLGPSSAWHLRPRVLGRVEVLTRQDVRGVKVGARDVLVDLVDEAGRPRGLIVDHVIAAIGYWPDVERLTFLAPDIRAAIRHVEGMPILSRDFESSVPGLYVTGLASAGSFGPLMRFVAGADYTARWITGRLARASVPEDEPMSETVA